MKVQYKKYLVIAAKPFDLLNAYEFIYEESNEIQTNEITVCILGKNRNQKVLKTLCEDLNQDFTHLHSPDLYYSKIPYFLSLNLKPFYLNIIRALIFFLSKPFWMMCLLLVKNKLPRCDTLIMDCWRDKVAIGSTCNFKKMVIIDGGASTKAFDFLNEFNIRSAEEAIYSYLVRQSQSRPGRIRPSGKIANYFALQSSSMPNYLRARFFKKMSLLQSEAVFFSSYAKSNGLRSEIKLNSYKFSCSKVKDRSMDNSILILGYTQLDFLEDQVKLAKSIQKQDGALSIGVLLHPSDIDKASRNLKYKTSLEEKCKILEINIFLSKYSFEADLIFNNLIPPKHLITYRSSSITWIETLYPEVKIDVLDNIQ